jgi:hypothetical protein
MPWLTDTSPAVTEETWDAMTGVNLRSGFFLARGRQAWVRR